MSRLSKAIEVRIAESSDPDEAWHHRLGLAAYMARAGQPEQAQQIIAEARDAHRSKVAPGVLARVNFAEALAAFFNGDLPVAIDKIRRSRAIAVSTPDCTHMVAAGAAWEAHFRRNQGNWLEFGAAVSNCLKHIANADSETRARFSLVMADAWLELGDLDESERWYRAARLYANDCGDDALIAALIFNRAAMRTFNLRLAEAGRGEMRIEQCILALEEASARSYASFSGAQSMPTLLDGLKGQLLVVQGRYAEARDLLKASIESMGAGWRHIKAICWADVAYCNATLGDIPEAARIVEIVARELESVADPGDAVLVLHRLGRCSELLGAASQAEHFSQLRTLRLSDHEAHRARGRSVLTAIVESFGSGVSEVLVGMGLRRGSQA